ncbi:MAG: undecaprenyldiphospho-muramoylpentapeptide beta-N-acetylglucosaminyltransferase [Pseudomonadota bacterium]|nr:undecaprenyldiphospho-muramoylpentapeptide beta-N-acetylglucosaminyltransferase [Pseudomonadota bacterium]
MNAGIHIMLTAGGTGGHIFPAVAVAEELISRKYAISLITDNRAVDLGFELENVSVHRVKTSRIHGGLLTKINGVISISAGIFQAQLLLRKFRSKFVIGFGGYPTVPTMLAAAISRLPYIIHEQNAVIGRANRLVAKRASGIATSFTKTIGLAPEIEGRVMNTGNPVRSAFTKIRGDRYPKLHRKNERLRILILGGSQGAKIFSEVIPQTFINIPEKLRQRFYITQQCRAEDIKSVQDQYRQAGMSVDLKTFFHNVPELMGAAHIVITRSGASTVAELAEAGRPAILVPYPNATDDHQTVNARSMEAAGAGWLIPNDTFTPETLQTHLERLITTPEIAMTAANAARLLGGGNAAARVVDEVEKLLKPAEFLKSQYLATENRDSAQ